jgi:phage major head subunit gpT-like protein
MALLTGATIAALQTTFDQQFRSGYADSPTYSQNFTTTVPSSVRTNTYGWMARLPSMRQWIGARTIQNLTTHDYTLTNLPYELTIGVDRDDIEDDNLGVYSPMFQEMGRAASKLMDQRVRTALQAGATTGLCFDGNAFFDTTHDLDPAGNQSNNFTGTALTAANYASTRQTMMAYTGEDGEPLGVMPNLLIVPPQLEDEARTILNSQIILDSTGTAGVTNVYLNSASLLVVPELANQATTWYLADTSRPIKPLIWQNRRSPQLVSMASPDDINVFNNKQLLWGVDGRGAAGYALWWLMARAIA